MVLKGQKEDVDVDLDVNVNVVLAEEVEPIDMECYDVWIWVEVEGLVMWIWMLVVVHNEWMMEMFVVWVEVEEVVDLKLDERQWMNKMLGDMGFDGILMVNTWKMIDVYVMNKRLNLKNKTTWSEVKSTQD